jgi:hypothetical protein
MRKVQHRQGHPSSLMIWTRYRVKLNCLLVSYEKLFCEEIIAVSVPGYGFLLCKNISYERANLNVSETSERLQKPRDDRKS